MEFIQFHNSLIVFFIIITYYQNIVIEGQFTGEIIPENYKLFFDFSGTKGCLMSKCVYNSVVTITMTVSGRANSLFIQSDRKTVIDYKRTQLNRIYQNETKTSIPIRDYDIVNGEKSIIIEIQIDNIFQILSETIFELTLYFSREFSDHRGLYNPSINTSTNDILFLTHLVPNRANRYFPCLNTQHKWLSSYDLTIAYPIYYDVVTGFILENSTILSPTVNISTYKRMEKIPIEHFFFAIWHYALYEVGPLRFWYPHNINPHYFLIMRGNIIKLLKQISHKTNTVAPVYPVMNIAAIPSSRIVDYYSAPSVMLLKMQKIWQDNVDASTADELEALTVMSRAVASQWISTLIYPKLRSDLRIYHAISHYIADFLISDVEPTFRKIDLEFARTILWTRCDRNFDVSNTIPFYLFDTWEDKMYFRREDYVNYQIMIIIAMVHEIYNFEDVGPLITQALMRWGARDYGPSQEELVNVLERDNINILIEKWSKIPGVPVIHVVLDQNEEYAELIQERFNSSGPFNDHQVYWPIPIRCTNSTTKDYYSEWIMGNSTFITSAHTIKDCLFNINTVVPFRINYPENWWIEIIKNLKNNYESFDEMQKMRIIDDMLEFCLAGYIKIHVLFELLSYMINEIEYFPWLAATKAFVKIRGILSTGKNEEYKLYYQQFVTKLIINVYEYLDNNYNVKKEKYNHLHRRNIIQVACGFGYEGCLKNAEDKLECYINEMQNYSCKNSTLCFYRWRNCMRDSDEREVFICQGIRRASTEDWGAVFKLLDNQNLSPSARLVIARGLACTENLNILQNYLFYVLENSELFPSEQVFPILLTAARLDELHAQTVLHFIIKTYKKLVERLELTHEYQHQIFELTQNMYYLNEKMRKIHLQNSPLTYADLPKTIRKILEVNTIRANRLRPMIEDYLKVNHENFLF